jgi:hypothetical protein
MCHGFRVICYLTSLPVINDIDGENELLRLSVTIKLSLSTLIEVENARSLEIMTTTYNTKI